MDKNFEEEITDVKQFPCPNNYIISDVEVLVDQRIVLIKPKYLIGDIIHRELELEPREEKKNLKPQKVPNFEEQPFVIENIIIYDRTTKTTSRKSVFCKNLRYQKGVIDYTTWINFFNNLKDFQGLREEI